ALRFADPHLVSPPLTVEDAEHDRAGRTERHPHQIEVALAIRGQPVKHIRAGIARELLFGRPRAPVEHARVEIEITAFQLLLQTVDTPDPSASVFGERDPEM